MEKENKFYSFRNEAETKDTVDIYVYSDVDERSWWNEDAIGSKEFQAKLAEYPDAKQINVYINSLGGDVMEGTAIYTMLKRHNAKVTAYVDGFACSIASVIAMAADEVVMGSSSALMIHNPWTWAAGNAQDFRKIADDLDKINEGIKSAYLEKCGDKIDEGTLTSLMDNESYITAKEAVEYGFADSIAESKISAAEALDKAVASVDRSNPFMAKKIDLISAKLKEQPEEKKISASAMEIFMSFFK